MRFLLIIAVTLLSFSTISCYKNRKDRVPVFATFFGQIQKYSLRPDVMNILGNPAGVDNSGVKEVWYYSFGQGKDVNIHFINGKVIDVKNNQGKSTLIEIN